VGQTRRPAKKSHPSLKFIFLFLSWPVLLVHRYWNNRPPNKLKLISFEDVEQDIQWYVKDTGDLLSISLILLAFYFSVKSVREKIAVGAFLLISIIDIANYWLWYKRNEYIVQFEFIILIVAALLMGYKFKRNAQNR
jgi:lipopolysaccharide export LptBFGC system permease protein LptF